MHKLTIYLDRIGGQFEARFWQTDEGRYYRATSDVPSRAIARAARASGYSLNDCKIVRTY